MFKVGLSGNYYSGQNEVYQILEEYEVPVFNANLITKFMINYSPKHIKQIKSTFGENSYNLGLLNLNKFTSNSDYDKLFEIIEFDLLKSFELFRIQNKNSFYTIFYFDQLFERGINNLMNFSVTCYRPKYQRRSDMKYLTTLSDNIINKILDTETDELIKNEKSDFVIHNYNKNGDYKSDIVVGLDTQVFKLHKSIMAKKMDTEIYNQYPLEGIGNL
jgi:dephospho-CoA kinase